LVIKASSAGRIHALVADLRSDQAATQEAASAQLIVIGARAVERILSVLSDPLPGARIAALKTLEAIGDPRALAPLLAAVDDVDPSVARAAVAAARGFLGGAQGVRVAERLTRLALDRQRDETLRAHAVDALVALKTSTVRPLLEALAADPSETLREAARTARAGARDTRINSESDEWPAEAPAIRRSIIESASKMPLTRLVDVLKDAREHERAAPQHERGEWMALRGAAHVALARRGSRLGVYDLRESLEEGRSPLPADFLAALAEVGDASCLEAIAGAYVRAGSGTRPAAGAQRAWRDDLTAAFAAIVRRERLTRRHAVAKKIGTRWPSAAGVLWPVGRR
jgi:HEAT repeat protein